MSTSPLIRRLLVFTSLAAFVSACVGVPLTSPNQLPQKNLSTPFPCQDSICGCMSADQCWKSCCCRSNREKLAWAKKHGVTPPTFVLAAAELELPLEQPTKKACCSAAHAAKNCCSHKTACETAASQKSNVCADERCERSTDGIVCPTETAQGKSCCSTKQTAKNVRWRWASGVSALKCRGLAYDWTTLGMIDVPPVFDLDVTIAPVGWVSCFTPSLTTVDDSPTVPPPRRYDA
jgi:hypothetical protein